MLYEGEIQLTNLTAFKNEMTNLVHEEGAVVVVYNSSIDVLTLSPGKSS